MEWYWYVLIGAGVVAIASIKLKVLGKWMEARQKRERGRVIEE
jgi:hypothetical protein